MIREKPLRNTAAVSLYIGCMDCAKMGLNRKFLYKNRVRRTKNENEKVYAHL